MSNLKYLMNTPVNELLRAAVATDPSLRERTPEITKMLITWAQENGLSIQAVTAAWIHWMTTGTDEAIASRKNIQ